MNYREWFENSDTETLLRSLQAIAGVLSEEESEDSREKMNTIIELLREKQIKFPQHRNLIDREISQEQVKTSQS